MRIYRKSIIFLIFLIANLFPYSNSDAFIDALDLEYVRDIALIRDHNSYYLNFVIDIVNRSKNDLKLNDMKIELSFDLNKEHDIYIGLSKINQLKIPAIRKTNGKSISINVPIEDIEQLHLDLISSNEIQSILTDFNPKIQVRLIGDFDIGVRSSMGWTYQKGIQIDWVIRNSLSRDLLIATYKDIEKASDIIREKDNIHREKDFLTDEHLFEASKKENMSFEEHRSPNESESETKSVDDRFKSKSLKKIVMRIYTSGNGNLTTTVYDLPTGMIVRKNISHDGKGLSEFFKSLKETGAIVQFASIDILAAHAEILMNYFPHAQIIYDRVAIMQKFDEELIAYQHYLFDETGTDVILEEVIGEFLDIFGKCNQLGIEGKKYDKMEIALDFNQPLTKAYIMKDLLSLFWQQESMANAENFLSNWINIASVADSEILLTMAGILQQNKQRCLNWHRVSISMDKLNNFATNLND